MISQITSPGAMPQHLCGDIDTRFCAPRKPARHGARARSGNTWPGQSRIHAAWLRNASLLEWCATGQPRKCRETPSPPHIDSQNAVPKRDVFLAEIKGKWSRSQISAPRQAVTAR